MPCLPRFLRMIRRTGWSAQRQIASRLTTFGASCVLRAAAPAWVRAEEFTHRRRWETIAPLSVRLVEHRCDPLASNRTDGAHPSALYERRGRARYFVDLWRDPARFSRRPVLRARWRLDGLVSGDPVFRGRVTLWLLPDN